MFNLQITLRKAKTERVRIGLAENTEYRCVITRSSAGLRVDWQPVSSPFELPKPLQGGISAKNFAIFQSVPHQFIWNEVFTLPLEYDEQTVLEHIHYVIEDKLPIHLRDIYYDYQVRVISKQKLQEITVFVLRKEYADKCNSRYHCVLDNELNCFWRGFQELGQTFLNQEYKDDIYQVGKLIFHLKEGYVTLIDETPEGKKCLNIDQLKWKSCITDKALYLAALGATLWEK